MLCCRNMSILRNLCMCVAGVDSDTCCGGSPEAVFEFSARYGLVAENSYPVRYPLTYPVKPQLICGADQQYDSGACRPVIPDPRRSGSLYSVRVSQWESVPFLKSDPTRRNVFNLMRVRLGLERYFKLTFPDYPFSVYKVGFCLCRPSQSNQLLCI